MITLLTTADHDYTHTTIAAALGRKVFRKMSYERLFQRRELPPATYIFTDFDRLSIWDRELAARISAILKAAGQPVLNDPARYLDRLSLLKRLKDAGVNQFDAWSPGLGHWPERYPVFLRTQAAHRGCLSDLLTDRAAAEAALEAALAQGHGLMDLAFIEFAATPEASGTYRKLAAFRIGEQVFAAETVNQDGWVAKLGTLGAASDASYARDLAEARANTHEAFVRAAFEVAGITYGRLDFGFWNGAHQAYEINTNPVLGQLKPHPNADRSVNLAENRDTYLAALRAIDSAPKGAEIDITPAFAASKYRPRRWAKFLHRRINP